MRRSTDRILTTHVGALQRPAELSKALAAHGPVGRRRCLTELRAGGRGRGAAAGRDRARLVDDGEFGKTMWSRYVLDRLDGIEGRDRVRRRRAGVQGPRP